MTSPVPFAYGNGIGQNSVKAIEGLAAQSNIPMTVTSTYRPGAGFHGTGNAVDFSDGGDAGTPTMDAFAAWWLENYAAYLLELIHVNMDGTNVCVKNGQVVDGSFYGAATLAEHHNHVHVAATNDGINAAEANGPSSGAASAGTSGTSTPSGALSSSKGFAIFSAGFWKRIGIGAAGVLVVVLALHLAKGGLHVRNA